MNTEMRERAILPVLIPILAIVVTEIVVFSMSRVLLTAGHNGAVVIAIAISTGILVGAAAIAARPRIKTNTIVGLLVVVGIVAIAAGAYAMQQGPFWGEEAAHATVEADVTVQAANLAFDTEQLDLDPAGTGVELINADTEVHNISVYPSETELSSPLFEGDLIDPGTEIVYEVPELEAGVYYFHCDVHPTMAGEAVVG